VGGYSDWLRMRAAPSPQANSNDQSRGGRGRDGGPAAVPIPATPVAPAVRPRKLGFKEQRELQELPARIAALETEQAALAAAIADPSYYSRDVKVQRTDQDRLQSIETELFALLEKWESLEQRSGSAG
jgi:ATP-binding cassette subfamily F protein uup